LPKDATWADTASQQPLRITSNATVRAVESVPLDPELSRALHERAEREGRTNSELIRDALRRYLQAS
jgi:predicted DNA-binding protein